MLAEECFSRCWIDVVGKIVIVKPDVLAEEENRRAISIPLMTYFGVNHL